MATFSFEVMIQTELGTKCAMCVNQSVEGAFNEVSPVPNAAQSQIMLVTMNHAVGTKICLQSHCEDLPYINDLFLG